MGTNHINPTPTKPTLLLTSYLNKKWDETVENSTNEADEADAEADSKPPPPMKLNYEILASHNLMQHVPNVVKKPPMKIAVVMPKGVVMPVETRRYDRAYKT